MRLELIGSMKKRTNLRFSKYVRNISRCFSCHSYGNQIGFFTNSVQIFCKFADHHYPVTVGRKTFCFSFFKPCKSHFAVYGCLLRKTCHTEIVKYFQYSAALQIWKSKLVFVFDKAVYLPVHFTLEGIGNHNNSSCSSGIPSNGSAHVFSFSKEADVY